MRLAGVRLIGQGVINEQAFLIHVLINGMSLPER
jgi:hypothetical protein